MPRRTSSAGSSRSKKSSARKQNGTGSRHQSLVGRVTRSISQRIKNILG
jgi:hypothetical protein